LETDRSAEARRELERNLELDSRHSAAIELLIDSMILTHDEESAAALMRSVHVRNIPHPADLHLEIAAALEDHARMESAAEQYSLVLSEKVSDSGRRRAELGLSRTRK